MTPLNSPRNRPAEGPARYYKQRRVRPARLLDFAEKTDWKQQHFCAELFEGVETQCARTGYLPHGQHGIRIVVRSESGVQKDGLKTSSRLTIVEENGFASHPAAPRMQSRRARILRVVSACSLAGLEPATMPAPA